jgi:hypothetical protein
LLSKAVAQQSRELLMAVGLDIVGCISKVKLGRVN